MSTVEYKPEGGSRQAQAKAAAATGRLLYGVCPCCNRSFPNVLAHIRSKHPTEVIAEIPWRQRPSSREPVAVVERSSDGHWSLTRRGQAAASLGVVIAE